MANDLSKLNEAVCEAAILILRRRLESLRNPEYYLSIRTDDLPLSTRARNVLKNGKLDTVMDILECGYDSIEKFQFAGPKTIHEITAIIERLLANKNNVRGLTGAALARVIGTIPGAKNDK